MKNAGKGGNLSGAGPGGQQYKLKQLVELEECQVEHLPPNTGGPAIKIKHSSYTWTISFDIPNVCSNWYKNIEKICNSTEKGSTDPPLGGKGREADLLKDSKKAKHSSAKAKKAGKEGRHGSSHK